MRFLLLSATTLILTGCFATGQNYNTPQQPEKWTEVHAELADQTEIDALKSWWKKFEDPALNTLIDLTLNGSPDIAIAQARVNEARGLRRTARGSLFPQISASTAGGREDNGQGLDNFYDARFDASFELDVFGQNRNTFRAADSQLESLIASYHDTTLTLIAEVARTYIDFRAAEKQVAIAKKNLDIQQKTLDLIIQQKELGEAPQLDVDRSETLVNTTRASIPEFQRLADNARLRLTVLTGVLPTALEPTLSEFAEIPGANVQPVLMAPAEVLRIRPDIRAAEANFQASTSLAKAATAEIFPQLTLSGFFGAADNALFSSTRIWEVALGAAVSLIDFGRIEGAIDAARAVETVAYETYRKSILEAVTEVETALVDYARINEQRISLDKAYENADHALKLSQDLFREGEISFIDVLDAQRTVNEADSALVSAEAAQAESLIRLYKSLGVY